MHIELDLDKIKLLGEKRSDDNFRFRSYLKNLEIEIDKLDKLVHIINDEVTSQIDCTQCANCCNTISPLLSLDDVSKFAKGINISSQELITTYCIKSESDIDKFSFNKVPCPFLKDNKCTNYEYRPEDCMDYPHLHKEHFVFRLWGAIDNYSICPIVFNVYEKLKEELWNRNWRQSLKDI